MKIRHLICIGFISLLFVLSGCAQLQQYNIEQNCNASAAYASGINDAKNGQDMQRNYASDCPANNQQLNDAYQKGFKFGLAHTPAPGAQVNIYNGGNGARGYGRQCIKDNFGDKACGYNCVKTPFKVQCANIPGNNCVKNVFNDIQCGRNCRVDAFNNIKCDSQDQ